jgi:hypothetical protein
MARMSLSDYTDCHDADDQIGRFIDEAYMQQLIHSSQDWLTSVAFEQRWREQQYSSPS